MRPRFTAGRFATSFAQRCTLVYFPASGELGGVIDAAQRHAAKPWPDCHIRNGIFLTRYVTTARQLFVQHVEQAFSFHGEAIDSVLNLHWRVVIEVAKTAAEERGRAL